MLAFVIGNGESRLSFDLNLLKGRGVIYGCNALYRDFHPDILVAGDYHMIEEIKQNYNGKLAVINKKKLVIDFDDKEYKIIGQSGWYSGVAAAHLACILGADTVFMLGFDFHKTEKINNAYKGTKNYFNADSSANVFGTSLHTESIKAKIFRGFPNKKFFLVNDIPFISECQNVKCITYSDFIGTLC